LIIRRLRSRFVSSQCNPPFCHSRVFETLTVSRSRSKSDQVSARYSLGRMPVVIARANRTPYLVRNCRDELLGLLDIEHAESPPRLPRQIDGYRRVRENELPAYRLTQSREKDCVRIPNCARRQILVQQLAVERLDFNRRDSPSGLAPSRGRTYRASRLV